MNIEQWRAVSAFPMYEASSLGRIRSLSTYNRPKWPQVMTPSRGANGYLYVRTRRDGRSYNPTLHSLIADAFHGPRPVGLVIRHLDGNPQNNQPSNLRYGTPSENNDDSVSHGTHWEARQTECENGHPFTTDNTRVEGRPFGRSARRCRTCQREYDAARYAKRAVA